MTTRAPQAASHSSGPRRLELVLAAGGGGGPGTGRVALIGGGMLAIAGGVADKSRPHSRQNREAGAAGWPHSGQNRRASAVSAWPHARQNRAVAETWARQRGQADCDCVGRVITSPAREVTLTALQPRGKAWKGDEKRHSLLTHCGRGETSDEMDEADEVGRRFVHFVHSPRTPTGRTATGT